MRTRPAGTRAVRGLVLLAVMLLAACATTRCPMCGHWKSDEARSLDGLHQAREHGGIELPQSQVDTYSRDFFGRLRIECDRERCRAWFPEDDPDTKPWLVYTLTPVREHVWLWGLPELETAARSVELQPDGNCYEIEQRELGFGEWFCRFEPGVHR